MIRSNSIFLLSSIILFLPLGSVYTKDFNALCSTCRQLVDKFDKGLEKTAKQNFGGGNTEWEERKLSKYELRLVTISSFECNHMLEENEEHFETWWFKRKTKHPDLFKWFCIETIKVCCPKGLFGLDCNTCIGGADKPCHGNGKCDGDGTRSGNGKCSCDKGYEGEFCLDCSDGYFSALRNDTFSLCKGKHQISLMRTNQDCKECRNGWEKDPEGACIDINECTKDPATCKDNQYCLNTDGSFSCKECDIRCSGCKGPGASYCLTCADGFKDEESTCTDINECTEDPALCKDNQYCLNTDGSFYCKGLFKYSVTVFYFGNPLFKVSL
uniref:Cysteine-rich with EGF-like domains 2 n=1 Tax=Cyprinus carpio TaxID=7962 RepID=A0A8C2F609_CYPCA